MLISIRNTTVYTYDKPVSFSPHLVRLFPRQDPALKVKEAVFSTNADANVRYQRDLFDNVVARCFLPDKADTLTCDIRLVLDLTERNPFDFLLASHALTLPLNYLPDERRALAPYLAPASDEDVVGSDFWPFQPGRPTVEALVELNTSVYKTIRYEVRETGRALTPAETKARGIGACRDTSRMMAAIIRGIGLAVRLVSGYVCEFGKDKSELRAESSLHAWLEVYLPGAGWVGLDPTNGVLTDHHFISAAVGLTPEDISPIEGSYYGNEVVSGKMDATMEVLELES